MKNTIEKLKMDAIVVDGTTINVYNGKEFTATNKVSGFGSGKKTVCTITIGGRRYENVAIDRIKAILDGNTRTRSKSAQPATISDYCNKIEHLFAQPESETEEETKIRKEALKRVTKLTVKLRELEAALNTEDEERKEYAEFLRLQAKFANKK